MPNQQIVKVLSRLCILSSFVLCLAFLIHNHASRRAEAQGASERHHITVTANQLPPQANVTPVEIICENPESTSPNAIEKLSCQIKNNTNKTMTAGAVTVSTVLELDGTVSRDTHLITFDTNVHPDLHAMPGHNAIPPGGSYPLHLLPTSYPSGVIKDVIVQVDYVEFGDKTALGPNRDGSRIIHDIRDGAAKYKEWLVQKYNRAGKSANALAPLLEEDQALPEGIGLQTPEQQQGATIYRKKSHNTLKQKGAEGLTNMLTHKDLP